MKLTKRNSPRSSPTRSTARPLLAPRTTSTAPFDGAQSPSAVSAAPDPPPAVVVTDAIQAGLLPWHLADTFDDETTGFYWWGGDELYALAILIGDEPYVFFGDALRVAADQLCAIAEDPARELIGFNIKFDFHFLRERAIQLRARVLDASVALFLLDENKWSGQSHGLKHAVKQIFGFEMVEFKDMLGYVTEETGEFRRRKCKGCGGKGWRSPAHVVCDVCGGACVESTPKTRRRMRRIDEGPLEVVPRYTRHSPISPYTRRRVQRMVP